MHSNAYVDEAPVLGRYQPLRSGGGLAVYADAPACERATTPEKIRATGKTRRAAVHGTVVQFMVLSHNCKATPVWNTFWTQEYPSAAEAEAAAQVWTTRLHIARPTDTMVGA